MSWLFARLLKAGRLRPPSGTGAQQSAQYIRGKPPKDKIGALESMFVLTVMTLSILGPSGWILSHLEDYKSRSD
uniref:Cytochrome c oxidase subunit 8A, mitochondrial n=1 Tax=Salarias fasciatus TaxID=181472 RepID=A0A672J8J6_SALFA